MPLNKDLVTPVDLGNITTIGPADLNVHCNFDEETGAVEIVSFSLSVGEGEISGAGPYVFDLKKQGVISRSAETVPADIIAEVESLIDLALQKYAAQEGYDI